MTSPTTPRDDIGLSERLRLISGVMRSAIAKNVPMTVWKIDLATMAEAAAQLDAQAARVKELERENGVLRDMLLNPNPDQDPDNVRLHREKCDALDRATRLQQERDEALERAAKYEHALTPSAETKCAYIGEFKFFIDTIQHDDDGEEVFLAENVTVPWDTVKQIMAAIRRLAAGDEEGKK